MSEAEAVSKGRPVVYGVQEEVPGDLDTFSVSVEDLSDGILSNITCTLVGVETVLGGEEKESKSEPGTYYTTPDQMIWHLEVDDAFELGMESPNVAWYINLPKAVEKDGVRRRAAPGKNSDLGALLTSLEGLGVSSNPQNAVNYQFTRMSDLVGLHFHRETKNIEQRNGQKRRQDQITDIYGFNNEARERAGMPPAYMRGQEPVAAAAGKK